VWALPRRGAHKKNLLSIKVDISGMFSFNFKVFHLNVVEQSIFEVGWYRFVIHYVAGYVTCMLLDIDFGRQAETPTLTLKLVVVEGVQVPKLYSLQDIRARSLMGASECFLCLFTMIKVVYILSCW
jgi:hypothetical protein